MSRQIQIDGSLGTEDDLRMKEWSAIGTADNGRVVTFTLWARNEHRALKLAGERAILNELSVKEIA